jgi:ADP-ribosylglycohydrolase
MTELKEDYAERVYAGVLGKIIGVYLGRPIEGWSYESITEKFGEVSKYINQETNAKLVVADDDISGTFTFLRALHDFGYDPHLTAAQIGKTWQNYIIEGKTILAWGGVGVFTEHTAFVRLKAGMEAPESGSSATNSKLLSEQIGAQIFIDGWGMICPGDAAKAAELAKRAGSVSHDGEAVYAAQIVAALIAGAFVESDLDRLLNAAVELIPSDSVIANVISDVRRWHSDGGTWRETLSKIREHYGYDKFGGCCHVVPNHALIISALLYGNGDFSDSLKIVNTCGWDTDCNSANVGAILGVRNGLAAFEVGPDWRGPVADRLYLPTADGGRCITDAVIEARHVINAGRALLGHTKVQSKNGARFAFEFPGSVQGFVSQSDSLGLSNPDGLGLALTGIGSASTPTFVPEDELGHSAYALVASPTLYSGQTLVAEVGSTEDALVRLFVQVYEEDDKPVTVDGTLVHLTHSSQHQIRWEVPNTHGRPIFSVGIEVIESQGAILLESLSWRGEAEFEVTWPDDGWVWGVKDDQRLGQWVSSFDQNANFRLVKNSGRGLLTIGTELWHDYKASIVIKPHMCESLGVAVRYQGLERYYALVINRDGTVRLIKRFYGEAELARAPSKLNFETSVELTLLSVAATLSGYVDGVKVLEYTDEINILRSGGIGVLVDDGAASLLRASVSAGR